MTSDDFKPAAIKPMVEVDDLEKLDIRVGTIRRVEDIQGSKTLMKLVVDFGDHSRQILAGIKKEREMPKELEGAQALFLVNLKPRTMLGQVSEGMLLDIGYADGLLPAVAQPEREVPNGARAG